MDTAWALERLNNFLDLTVPHNGVVTTETESFAAVRRTKLLARLAQPLRNGA